MQLHTQKLGFTTIFLAALLTPTMASAASLSPENFEATIDVGETIFVDKTVTLDEVAVSKLDVFFLADNTGSMGSILRSVKSSATSLLTDLDTTFDDIAFGVGSYFGDPKERITPDAAYRLLEPVASGTNTDTVDAIDSWVASGGGDFPEGNFFGLHQLATSGGSTDGVGADDTVLATGQDTQWREGAKRFVIWFGDAPSHTTTVDQNEALQALLDNDVTVLALNSRGAGSGIDQDGQATFITSGTDGLLENSVNASSVVETISSLVGDATSTIDLEFGTIGDTSGLDVSFSCTDSLGCTDVGGGESRTFQMSVTGNTEGVYNFQTSILGLADAVGNDTITVGRDVDPPTTPEPTTILSLLGLGAWAFASNRKRSI